MEFNLINFSPFSVNILDCIGAKNLYTRKGDTVEINQFHNYVIKINGVQVLSTDDNIAASYFLNCRDVGYMGNKIIK